MDEPAGRGARIWHVDAFTDRPFGGNPAAVVLSAARPAATTIEGLVRELGLPATVFLHPRDDGSFDLRWFTPRESDLCGHGTLAAAHALVETGLARADRPLTFHTRAGTLTAERDGGWIVLDLPTLALPDRPASPELERALGVHIVHLAGDAARSLVEVAEAREVVAMRPDFPALARLEPRGVIVTARGADGAHDFVSRYFKPYAGIDEDPVTGSAHAALAPFWAARLGKADFVARQASARGGTLRVGLRGERVRLGGRAVTISAGKLLVDLGSARG